MVSRSANLRKGALEFTQDKWVNVTWMPHTMLSQTSHVCLTVHSAHTNDATEPQEWKVSVTAHGIGGLSLISVSTQTTCSSHRSDNPCLVARGVSHCYWNYFLQLPIRWRELPRDAYLRFEILSGDSVQYRGTLPLFNRYGKLITGLQKVAMTTDALDARNYGLTPFPTTLGAGDKQDDDQGWIASWILDDINRREDRSKPYPTHFREIATVPWLDSLARERCMDILEETAVESDLDVIDDTSLATLIVELPTFDIPILYEETFYPVPQNGASGAVTPLDLAVHRKQAVVGDGIDPLSLVSFLEYEHENDNPVEDKYRTLAHDLIRGIVDPALKPDKEQRKQLAAIIDSPSHHPSREEKDLLWRFRFSLVDNRRALTKFLLAVDWMVESEVVQAAELLEQWRKRSPIEVTDALKLLGKNVAFQTNLVRDYAIDTLAAAPDSELRLYLLQLVQALKYENTETLETKPTSSGLVSARSPASTSATCQVSALASFLIGRAAKNIELATYLYWYLKVEVQHPSYGSRYRDVLDALKISLSGTSFDEDGCTLDGHETTFKSIVDSVSKIGNRVRGIDNSPSDDKKICKHRTMWDVLVEQDEFISGVLDIQQRCRDARGKKDVKEAELRSVLLREGYNRNPKRSAIPLPSKPNILVNGVYPDTAAMFKSALYPAVIEFHVEGTLYGKDHSLKSNSITGSSNVLGLLSGEDRSRYKVIVKTGDDLRQDQLIIMMIQLMDRLLKRAALDLCLTPYAIIATSPSSGLVEFVEGAMPISQILSQHNGSIMQFFQDFAECKGAKYDVRPEVMSTYIRSCAGYCVVTYLLGVGDRHLDNIMLRKSGHFFHIDFGFIFGRDPKPLPPAFRLTREMVDGMGGLDSSEYRQFCSLACQAYNALRKSAGLVLNLIHLMADAEIQDLSNNPAGDAEAVIASFEERFRLDLTDEQAEKHFTTLITDCLAAIAPRVMDVFHSFAVARR